MPSSSAPGGALAASKTAIPSGASLACPSRPGARNELDLYLDYNASTPIDPRVADVMRSLLDDTYANPSALHPGGREAVGGVDGVSITDAVRLYHGRPSRVDAVTRARIGREREEAGRQLAQTRDVAAWQREMAQLDAEEQTAREPVEAGRLSSGEVVEDLRSLPSLRADAGPDGRQALATAIFARTDVLGFERLEYDLTADAIELGLNAALPAVFELRCTIAEFGRGERI